MNIMRSEIGAFFRLLVAVFFFFLPVFQLICVKGEGNTCTLQATGKCTNAIVTVDKKSAEEETSFNLYIYRQWIRELVAMLSYENGYICHETKGHTCTSLADGSFNVTLRCAPLQYVTLVGDGQQPMRCQPMKNPPVESTNNYKDSNCDCRHKRASRNFVYHSRQKRCPCPNASPENPDVNPNSRIEDDNGGAVDDGSLVIIIVMSLLATSVVAVVVFCRKRIFRRWKKNINEHISEENADTKDPLNSESTKC